MRRYVGKAMTHEVEGTRGAIFAQWAGAFRGQGRFGGAGVIEKFREDDSESKPTNEPSG